MMNELNAYRYFLLKVAKKNLTPSLRFWAEDLVQDAFEKASKNQHAFNAEKGKLSTWLAHMTTNLCKDFSKKKVNNEICFGDFFSVANESVWDSPADSYPNVRPYLKQLNSRYRMVLILKIRFKMSAKEMSKYLEVPAASVPVLVQRAKASLGTVMKNDGSDFSQAA